MQTIIDSAKAHGITPVIARIIATDSSKAGWQINPAYLEAVDKLVSDNGLPAGPDFYSYFREHPELLGNDGVHPNSNGGGQAMHHLWAEALAPLYAVGDTASGSSGDSIATDSGAVRLEHPKRLRMDAVTTGVFDMNGHYVGLSTQRLPQGLYIVRQKVQNRVVNKVFLKK